MQKYDIKVELKPLYRPTAKDVTRVTVPPMQFLAVDGSGDPNTSAAYADAIEALYTVAYTVKFASKSQGRDFVVGPLEGLWRADDPSDFVTRNKSAWEWTMLVSQPEWVTIELVAASVEKARSKKNLPALDLVRVLELDEGDSVQIMHHGSYDDEGPTLARLHHEFLPAHGLTFNGDHHEIYLSDARRTAPDKLKTILRQPVRPA